MASNGLLEFQGTNKATFVGANSNIVLDTVTSSLGIGVDVDGPTSNLHVVGNAYVSTELTVGGDVTVDSTTFHVDTTENRVGIGTNDPQVDLEIENVNGSPELRFTDPFNGGVTGWDARSNVLGEISWYSRDVQLTNSYAKVASITSKHFDDGFPDGALCFTTSTNGVLNEDAMVIDHTGNVGIGTTSPTQRLDVNGVIKSNVPSWHMYNTNTIHTGTLNFTTNKLTPQNCSVSLSTGRVTITVAGRYCVSFHAMTETSVASGTGCQIKIMKSGVDYVRNYHVQPAVGVTAGPTATSSIAATGGLTAIMYLAVDDYVEVNTNFLVHFNLGATFSGFMIG